MKRSILIIFMTHEEPATALAVASLLPQLGDGDTLLLLHNGRNEIRFGAKYEGLDRVEYFESDANLGVAGGRNLLFRQKACRDSDLVFLVDSDAFVPSDYLDRMTEFMDGRDDVGVAGPVVLDFPAMESLLIEAASPVETDLCGVFLSLSTAAVEDVLAGVLKETQLDHIGTNPDWREAYLNGRDVTAAALRKTGLQSFEPFHGSLKFEQASRSALQKWPGDEPSEIPVSNIAGCCQVFRRALVEQVGELYEPYSPYGFEDVDFCVRALDAGFRNVTTNASYMFHKTDPRHGLRATREGQFRKRVNESRVRTIFEYRWDREGFPRNSLRRVTLRAFRAQSEAGDVIRVREGLIAEMVGVRKALRQLGHAEGPAFGQHLQAALDSDRSLAAVYRLLDTDSGAAAGLAGHDELAEQQAVAETLLYPPAGGPRWPRFDVAGYGRRHLDAAGAERFGNAYPSGRQDVISDEEMLSLEQFRGIHEGERCFIVGNGPSLNKTDFSLLRNEKTFAVNGIFYLRDKIGFVPTYYVVEDNHVVDDNLAEIIGYPAPHKFFPAKYRAAIGGLPGVHLMPANWEFYFKSSEWYETPRFSRDISRQIFVGQTVTYLNLQLAHYMGFSTVILIGVDFNYVVPETSDIDGLTILSNEDDPNHFHPEYFGKGKKWHFPKLHNCEKVYRHARAEYERDGREVLDATIGGKLEVFDKVDYDTLVEDTAGLERPNDPLTYFLRRVLLEQTDGEDPALPALEIDDELLSGDLAAVRDWYATQGAGRAKAGRTAPGTAGEGPHGRIRVTASVPEDGAGGQDLVFLTGTRLLRQEGGGARAPSQALSDLMSAFENVVLHGDFALATNGALPRFLSRDFGISTNTSGARRLNVSAALDEAGRRKAGTGMVELKVRTLRQNDFRLKDVGDDPDELDMSLAGALLEQNRVVYIKSAERLFF